MIAGRVLIVKHHTVKGFLLQKQCWVHHFHYMEYCEDSCEEKRDTDASHYMLLEVQFKGDVC